MFCHVYHIGCFCGDYSNFEKFSGNCAHVRDDSRQLLVCCHQYAGAANGGFARSRLEIRKKRSSLMTLTIQTVSAWAVCSRGDFLEECAAEMPAAGKCPQNRCPRVKVVSICSRISAVRKISQTKYNEVGETSVVLSETLIFTGVSILVLLAGILIALKVR